MDIPSTPAPTERSCGSRPRCWAAPTPAPSTPAAQEKVKALLDAGVTLFLDLTTADDGPEPYEDLLTGGQRAIRRINLPVPDVTVPSDETVQEALRILDDEIVNGGVA